MVRHNLLLDLLQSVSNPFCRVSEQFLNSTSAQYRLEPSVKVDGQYTRKFFGCKDICQTLISCHIFQHTLWLPNSPLTMGCGK